jgi:hypothetical protein
MTSALKAGCAYFLIVFAIGFVLGTIRVLLVIPRLGDTSAVLLELPVMLALSWIACAWLVRRFAVPPAAGARLTMGALAFALLMVGELLVSVFGFGRTPVEHLGSYRAAGAQLGLVAQLAFAFFPYVQSRRGRVA